MSIDELAAGIGGTRETVQRAATEANTAKDQATRPSSTFAGLGADGKVAQMNEVAEQLGTAYTALTGIADGLEQTQSSAAAAKDGGLPAGGSASPPPKPRPRGIPGFTPRRLNPTAIEAIEREGWPKTPEGKLKARGHLYDDRGHQPLGRTLKALPYGQTYDNTDLKEPWRSDIDYTTTWHVEGGVAEYMRRREMKSATLYLNAPTCGGDDRDPKRCYQNVAKALPEGSTLTVWSILEGGGRRRVTFRGTGEAIQ